MQGGRDPCSGRPQAPSSPAGQAPPGTALPHSPQPPAGSQPCHRAPSRRQPSPPLTRPSLTPTVPARSQPRGTRLRRPSPAAPAAAGARAAPAGRGHRRRPPHHAATGTPRGHPHLHNGGEAASRGDAVPVPLAVPQPRVPPRLSGTPTSASARTGKGRGHVITPLRLAATSSRAGPDGPGRRLVPEAARPPRGSALPQRGRRAGAARGSSPPSLHLPRGWFEERSLLPLSPQGPGRRHLPAFPPQASPEARGRGAVSPLASGREVRLLCSR